MKLAIAVKAVFLLLASCCLANPPEDLGASVQHALKTGAAKIRSQHFAESITFPRCGFVVFDGACGDYKTHRRSVWTSNEPDPTKPAFILPWNPGLEFRRIEFRRTTPGPLFKMYGKEATWYTFDNCKFAGVGEGKGQVDGVLLTEGAGGNNSDTTIFDRCIFEDLRYCLVMDHYQSLCCRIRDSRAARCERLVLVNQGGDLLIDNTSLYDIPVGIEVGKRGATRNTATINLLNVRMDGNSSWTKGFTAVDAGKSVGPVRINAIGGTLRGGNEDKPPAFIPAKNGEVNAIGVWEN